nr:uncharacterized protein LOC108007466 isoform X10 [Drosophila suzukii]
MVPKRNHGYVTIFVAVVLVCLLKILFWNPPLPILTIVILAKRLDNRDNNIKNHVRDTSVYREPKLV